MKQIGDGLLSGSVQQLLGEVVSITMAKFVLFFLLVTFIIIILFIVFSFFHRSFNIGNDAVGSKVPIIQIFSSLEVTAGHIEEDATAGTGSADVEVSHLDAHLALDGGAKTDGSIVVWRYGVYVNDE